MAPPMVEVVLGDCVEVMAGWEDASIDAIVCDPPYGLEFMGKAFDKLGDGPRQQAFHAAWAGEALRVLKPGGYLLAFGGSRTYHRLACAIEDAGFEIRDCVMWLYGCLSADSEALTRRGWVRGPDLRPTDDVLQWDAASGAFSWVRPSRVLVAPYAGPMVRLVNRHTDQMLTPNHRVLARVQRHSRHSPATDYETLDAADVESRPSSWRVTLPVAGRLQEGTPVDPAYAYLVGWWLTDAWAHKDGRACMFSQTKPRTLAKLRAALAPHNPSEYARERNPGKHAAEHTFYLTGPLADRLLAEHPDRRLSWDVLGWSAEARAALFRGLMDGDGSQPVKQYGHTFWSQNAERRDVFLALAVSLGHRAYIGERGCVYVNTNTDTTEIQARHRTPAESYAGSVWCVTVPSGAFLARRNGRPFVTGNSGFPKSLDVSKAIDKIDRVGPMRDRALAFTAWMRSTGITTAQINAATGTFMGSHYLTDKEQPAVATADLFDLLRPILPPVPAEIEELVHSRTVESENMKRRAVVGSVVKGSSPLPGNHAGHWGDGQEDGAFLVTAPYTDAARAWHGWGTALKPAHEPVVVARKPLEGTVAANVLKYGTGAMNIDGCRVPPVGGETVHAPQSDPTKREGEVGRDLGFTANDAAKFRQAQRESIERTNTLGRWPANVIHDGSDDVVAGFPVTTSGKPGTMRGGVNSGAAYGAESRPPGTPMSGFGDTGSAARFFYCAKASRAEREAGLSAAAGERANRHPTVKPVAVMEYLLRLVMPPGGIALDPFAGSGTTLVAAARLGMNAIGIEREPEYHAIAEARIRAALAADPAAAPSPTDTDTEGEE